MTGRRWLGLIVGTLATLAPRAVGAQEPTDTTPQRPQAVQAAQDTAGPAAGDTAAPPAPRPLRPVPRVVVGVSAGLARFTDLQAQAAQLTMVGAEDEPVALRRTLGVDGGVGGTASVLINVSPTWGLRVGVGTARGTLKAEYEAEDTATSGRATRLPVVGARDITITTVEGSIQYRIPSGLRLHPYLELGGAAMRWSVDATPATVFAGASDLLEAKTRAAVEAVVGATITLGGGAAARIEAATQLFRTPLGTTRAGSLVAAGDSASLAFAEPIAARYSDVAIELVRALKLQVGLTYGVGRVAPAPPPEPAAALTPSPSPR